MSNRLERTARWLALALLVLALILVPFALFEQPLSEWSSHSLRSARQELLLAAITVLLLVADILLPIPSSLVAATAVGWLGVYVGGSSVWLGMTLAALLGYGVGRVGGTRIVEGIVGSSEYARAARLIERHGVWILLLCRGVPVLAEASALFAGAVRFSLARFLIATGLANLGLVAAYATSRLLALGEPLDSLAPFALGVVVPGLSLLLYRALLERRAGAKSHGGPTSS